MLPWPGRVCDQCGDVGFLELLATCSSCSRTRKHIYCMDKKLDYVPEEWYCGDCLPAASVIRENSETISSKDRGIEVPINQSFGQKSTKGLLKQHAKNIFLGSIYSKQLKAIPPKNAKVKFLPDEEVASLNTGKLARTYSRVINVRPVFPQTNEERRHDNPTCGRVANDIGLKNFHGKQGLVVPANENNKQGGDIASMNCSRSPRCPDKGTQLMGRSPPAYSTPNCEAFRNGKGSTLCSDAQLNRENVDLPPQVIVILDADHPDFPSTRPHWKGCFEVSDGAPYVYCKVCGYLPGKLDMKAFQAVKKFPEKLKFKLLPRRNVWPEVFRSDPPTDQDAGLFFFPSDDGRSKEVFAELLKKIDKDDFALRSSLGNWDLVVYASKQLPQNSKDIIKLSESVTAMMGPFLWGLFMTIKKKGQHKLNIAAWEKETAEKKRPSDLGTIREEPAATPPSFETLGKRKSNWETEVTGGPLGLHQTSSSCSPAKSSQKKSLRGSSDKNNQLESPQAAVRFDGTQPFSSLERVASSSPKMQRIRSKFSTRPSSERPNAREAIDKRNGHRSLQFTPKSTSSKPFSSPGRVPPMCPELEVHEETPFVPPGFDQLANASVPRR